MLFLGTFMGCDEFSIPCTPINCIEINEVTISDGMFEKFYATKDIDSELNSTFPNDYDYDTILYAKYDKGSANAGNVDWDLNSVSHLLVKRKKKGTFDWTTIAVKEITDISQIELTGTDYTNAAKTTYEYAVVPSFYGIEGSYDITEINSDFNKIFIISRNGIIYTDITDAYLNIVNHAPSSSLIPLNGNHPIIIRNTSVNYPTGNFTGSFFVFDEETCNFDISDKSITDMQEHVISFLSNDDIKLIKHFDGRIYLINIDPDISNNANGHYKNRQIGFSFTEIGDVNSSEDLYNAGLSDVSEEWW